MNTGDRPAHPADGGPEVPKLTKADLLVATVGLLNEAWAPKPPLADNRTLRDEPPRGLRKNNEQIMALAVNISAQFHAYGVSVTGLSLLAAEDVCGLRDIIWAHIPGMYKA